MLFPQAQSTVPPNIPHSSLFQGVKLIPCNDHILSTYVKQRPLHILTSHYPLACFMFLNCLSEVKSSFSYYVPALPTGI